MMTTFSSEQLNFFKFSAVVLDEFPVALRKVFVYMWDNLVVPRYGCQKWDDSVAVLNWFLTKEGGVKKVPSLNKPLKDWDCTALLSATLFAQSFAIPDKSGHLSTLDKLYVKPCGLISGAFHRSVVSPSGDQAQTFALALDQLRLLRNTLCHQCSTRTFDKTTFEQYLLLAKDAFDALGQDKTNIDDIGNLADDDFPTGRVVKLEDELKREKDAAIKFKQIKDHLDEIELGVKDVSSDVKAGVGNLRSDIGHVVSKVKGVQKGIENVGSDVDDVKTTLKDVEFEVKSALTDVGAEVKAVKTGLENVRSNIEDIKTAFKDVGSEINSALTDVGIEVKDVRRGLENVGAGVENVKTAVKDVGSEVKSALTGVGSRVKHVKTELADVGSDVKEIKADFKSMKRSIEAESSRKARLQMRLDCEIVPQPLIHGEALNVVDTSQAPQVLPQCRPTTSQITSIQPQQHHGLTATLRTIHNVDETTQRVLNRIADWYIDTAPRTHEALSNFLTYMKEVKNVLVVDKKTGSLILTVECSSLPILDELWEDYRTGHLNEMVQKLLVTEEILREFGLLEVKMTTTILEEEYLACRKYFLDVQESFQGKTKGNETNLEHNVDDLSRKDLALMHESVHVTEDITHTNEADISEESFQKEAKGNGRNLEEKLNKEEEEQREIIDREGEARRYEDLGTVYQSRAENEKAEEFYNKSLAIRKEIGDRQGEARCYTNLGTWYHSRAEYEKAEKCDRKALVISEETSDREGEAACYTNLGVVYESRAEYEKAEEYYNRALVINGEIGDRKGEAACYTNLGIVYKSRAKYQKAEEYYNKALVISKEIFDREAEAACYINLGTVYKSCAEYERAEECDGRALVISKEIGDRQGEARCYTNLGIWCQSRAEYDKAKEYYKKALVVSEKIGDRKVEAACYTNLGIVYKFRADYKKAEEFYNKALMINKEIGDREGEAACYTNLGILYKSRAEY